MSPNEAALSPECEPCDPNFVHLEFSYQLRDFDQAKTQLRKKNGVDRTFYVISWTLIWTLLTPIIIIFTVNFFMWLYRLIEAGFVLSEDRWKLTVIIFLLGGAAATVAIVTQLQRWARNLILQRKKWIVELTPTGMLIRKHASQVHLNWANYCHYIDAPSLFILSTRTSRTIILPKRVMTPEQLTVVGNLLNTHIQPSAFPVLHTSPSNSQATLAH